MTQTTNQFHEQDDLCQRRIINICAIEIYGHNHPNTTASIHNALDVDDLLFIDHGYPLIRHLFLNNMSERENLIDDLIHLGKDELLRIHHSLDDNERLFDWLINHDSRVISIPNAGWVVAKDNNILIQERQHYDDDIPF